MQGRFLAMHYKLYEKHKVLEKADDPRATFIEYARSIGIDADRFTKDLSSEEADNRLVEDHKRAAGLGVTGTPTFFINGRELKGNATTGVTADVIRNALNSALENAQK